MSKILEIRLEQYKTPIGFLTSSEDNSVSFVYSADYLSQPDRIPLSISLPAQPAPYGDVETRAFFDNLLPENDQLRQVMEREGIPRDDIVSLLYYLGSDCSGAVSCIPLGSEPTKIPGKLKSDYDSIDAVNLEEIVRRLSNAEPLPNELRDPSPVAGVQRKIALTKINDQTFGIPRKDVRVPTTHILKVPKLGKGREARLESAAAQLARACGLSVVIPNVIRFKVTDALLIPRFDRRVSAKGEVSRIHQEDFAQALGLPASLKYERKGTSGRRFSAGLVAKLMFSTRDQLKAIDQFLAVTIFNLVIGNTDNHAKNHALLYDDGSTPQLAPFYDLLPIRLDPSVSHDLSFNIGSASHPDSITLGDVCEFFSNFGLSPEAAENFLASGITPMLMRLDAVAKSLVADGLKDFDDLIGREIDRLRKALKLGVNVRERDAYINTGGGWALSS